MLTPLYSSFDHSFFRTPSSKPLASRISAASFTVRRYSSPFIYKCVANSVMDLIHMLCEGLIWFFVSHPLIVVFLLNRSGSLRAYFSVSSTRVPQSSCGLDSTHGGRETVVAIFAVGVASFGVVAFGKTQIGGLGTLPLSDDSLSRPMSRQGQCKPGLQQLSLAPQESRVRRGGGVRTWTGPGAEAYGSRRRDTGMTGAQWEGVPVVQPGQPEVAELRAACGFPRLALFRCPVLSHQAQPSRPHFSRNRSIISIASVSLTSIRSRVSSSPRSHSTIALVCPHVRSRRSDSSVIPS